MFKTLKQKIKTNITNKTLVNVQLKDVKFTILKKSGKEYNKSFPNNIGWTKDQIKLREEIKNLNYFPNGEYPSLSCDNVCLDGHHRLTSLINYYPEDYVILVNKTEVNYRYIFWSLIFYVIFLGGDK